MDDKINITERLQKIVKQRNVPIVVNKREIGYKNSKSSSRGLTGDSYSYGTDDE